MDKAILVLNSGSSSIKFSLFALGQNGDPGLIFGGKMAAINNNPRFMVEDDQGQLLDEKKWSPETAPPFEKLLGHILNWIEEHNRSGSLVAVGHRVVHGGPNYHCPIQITPRVMTDLTRLNPLAPLHQPHNLQAISTISHISPQLPQVACFDTAFHKTIPAVAQAFALPYHLKEEGIRRYGFHGLSYEYIAQQLPLFDPRGAEGRTVVAHLGNGASMCALKKGQSIASSMGFSALEGLPMGTRSGALDPGVLLYLLQEKNMRLKALESMLYRKSGLLGISGISNDMRILLKSKDKRAQEALAIFVYRIQREIGAMAAVLGGLDSLVFTAGIGENAAPIRARVCRNAGWPRIDLDESANKHHGPRISTSQSPVSVWVIPTNEEVMIAGHTANLLDL